MVHGGGGSLVVAREKRTMREKWWRPEMDLARAAAAKTARGASVCG